MWYSRQSAVAVEEQDGEEEEEEDVKEHTFLSFNARLFMKTWTFFPLVKFSWAFVVFLFFWHENLFMQSSSRGDEHDWLCWSSELPSCATSRLTLVGLCQVIRNPCSPAGQIVIKLVIPSLSSIRQKCLLLLFLAEFQQNKWPSLCL